MDFRPLASSPEAAAAVAALLAESEAADGRPPLSEEKHCDFAAGAAAGLGIIGWEADEAVAYAHMLPGASGRWQVEMAVAPGRRSAATYRALATAAVAALPPRSTPNVWAVSADQAAALADLGLVVDFELRQLRRPLPPDVRPELPEGVGLRPFRPGSDEDAWLAAHNAAFAASSDGPGWDHNELAGRMSREWFDPEGFLLAWDGEELAGYCWTKVHPGAIGEIYIIGIDPRHQGRGLGAPLALAGLWDLYERRGCDTGMLYVDAANGPAVRLYERLGFSTARADRCFSPGQPNR